MSTRENLKSGNVVTTTTTKTTTTVKKKQDLALCELWTSFILGILVTLGAIGAFNWAMIGVGLLSAAGSGILIFVQDDNGVRRVGFWILVAALCVEGVAFIALLTVGIILVVPNSSFLGLGWFFGALSLTLAVPVLVMTVIDLTTVLKIRPQIFERAKIMVTESVSVVNEEEGTKEEAPNSTEPANDNDDAEVSASRSQKLPLLAIRK